MVGGSSAERVCCIHQYASGFSHFGQIIFVFGNSMLSAPFFITITSFFLECSVSLMSIFSFLIGLSLPHLGHTKKERVRFLFTTIKLPHLGQNSIASHFCSKQKICFSFFTFFILCLYL